MDFDLKTLLDMSPPFALLASLNAAIWLLKKAAPMPGWLIPWIAIAGGTLIYPLVSDSGKVLYSMRSPYTAQLLTGFLIGFAAVGTNQWAIKTLQKAGFWQEDEQPPTK